MAVSATNPAGGNGVRLREIVRAPKDEIKIGNWHSGKVPKADFPIWRAPYGLGSSYRWAVITFRAEPEGAAHAECRVLVVVNKSKQKFEAILGVMGANGALKVLCSYEHHPSEPGWHAHATHDDSETLSHGFMRGPWIKRVPGPDKKHRASRHAKFEIGDESAAIRFAIDCYKIEKKGPLL